MKKTLLAIALAAVTVPFTFAYSGKTGSPAKGTPAAAAQKSTHKSKKTNKKSTTTAPAASTSAATPVKN